MNKDKNKIKKKKEKKNRTEQQIERLKSRQKEVIKGKNS